MKNELVKLGVKRTEGQGCKCNNSNQATYTYNLPKGIDSSIYEYLKQFGASVFSFEKNAMIKIENADYSIMAINRVKNISLIIKNPNNNIIDKFESVLESWLERKNE